MGKQFRPSVRRLLVMVVLVLAALGMPSIPLASAAVSGTLNVVSPDPAIHGELVELDGALHAPRATGSGSSNASTGALGAPSRRASSAASRRVPLPGDRADRSRKHRELPRRGSEDHVARHDLSEGDDPS